VRLPADHAVRKEAVTTPDHAFVWASAGTGKTHTLILRALYLVFSLADPELYTANDRRTAHRAAEAVLRSIILTTFTRKAAAEMQVRLYEYLDRITLCATLEELLEADPEPDRDRLFGEIIRTLVDRRPIGSYRTLRRAAQALLESFSRLQVSTLHSFATSLLSRYPAEAGIPDGVRFAREDEDDLRDFNRELVRFWWRREASEDPEISRLLSALTAELPVAEIDRWLIRCVKHPWIPDRLEEHAREAGPDAGRVLEALGAYAESLVRGGGKARKAVEVGKELIRLRDRVEAAAGEGAAWKEVAGFLKKHEKYLFQGRNQTVERCFADLDPVHAAVLSNLNGLYLTAFQAVIRDPNGSVWPQWIRLLRSFTAWARTASIEQMGIVTFDDMIQLSVQLLTRHPAVRRKEASRIRALLVDEFQDTDPEQLRLIELLLRSGDTSHREPLGFFVGDIKQSIYRFRGADVDNIERFYRAFVNAADLRRPVRSFQLTTSFRSLPAVTGFVNECFSDALALAGPEEQLDPYRRTELPPPCWVREDFTTDGIQRLKGEALDWAARVAARLVRDYMRENSEARLDDILILTRDHAELDYLIPVFREEGIPVVSSGAQTFYRNPEVLDSIHLLIALHTPLDKMAAAVVLRSPVVGLDPGSIYRLLQAVPLTELFHGRIELPDWLSEQAAFRIEGLRELATNRTRSLLPDWLAQVRRRIPAEAYLNPRDLEGRVFSRIDRLFRSFQEVFLDCRESPLEWLLRQRRRVEMEFRSDVSLGEDVVVFDESINAVRMMTIHKAKGLQGKCVLLYGWSTLLHEVENPVRRHPKILELIDDSGNQELAFQLAWSGIPLVSSNWETVKELNLERSRAEAVRLAYVAATRAEDRLYCIAPCWSLQKIPEDVREYLEKESPAYRFVGFPPEMDRLEPPGPAKERAPLADLDRYRDYWAKRRSVSEPEKILFSPTDPDLDPEEGEPEIEGPDSISKDRALKIGSLVHEYLERYLDRMEVDRGLLENLNRAVSESDPAVFCDALAILERFYAGKTPSGEAMPYVDRVRSGSILAQEFPFFLHHENRNWQGVIDLVLEEEGGILVIDFKTGDRPAEMPASYRRQSEIYRRAVEELLPDRSVAFEFWWLGTATGDKRIGDCPL